MKIDLMSLAKEADKAYLDVQCSFGTIRVYHVPDALMLSAGRLDRPEPELPIVRMKLAGGGSQNRPAKKGDPQWDDYQAELATYENQTFELRNAAAMVYALKDIDWKQYDISKPPPSQMAMDLYNGNWPENELLRKRAWLNWTILLKRADQDKILQAMAEMRGENEPTEEDVDEVKKNSVSSSKPNLKD